MIIHSNRFLWELWGTMCMTHFFRHSVVKQKINNKDVKDRKKWLAQKYGKDLNIHSRQVRHKGMLLDLKTCGTGDGKFLPLPDWIPHTAVSLSYYLALLIINCASLQTWPQLAAADMDFSSASASEVFYRTSSVEYCSQMFLTLTATLSDDHRPS